MIARPYFSGIRLRILLCIGALVTMAARATAQSYLTQVGNPTFATPIPVELGYYDASTGDLHLQISLGSWSQRGGYAVTAALVYDSRIWYVNGAAWQPTNIQNSYGGWRLQITPASGGVTRWGGHTVQCPGGDPGQRYTYYQNFTWTDAYGTVRSFPIYTQNDPTVCNGGSVPSDTEWANDASGYLMVVTNYTTVTAIYGPDGSKVYPSFEDTNGNEFSRDVNGNLEDTLGRVPVTVTTNCNGNSSKICYNVLNSQGTTSTYTVTTESISVSTYFGQSGVTEYSGNITVFQSVQLPDGTSFQFAYDSGGSNTYGEMKTLTLPSQGSVTYTYLNYSDAFGNTNRWLYTRASGGGTWTYSPARLSSCNSGYSYCQKLVVTKPGGNTVQYSFETNAGSNGSWLASTTYFKSGTTEVRFVTTTWTSTSDYAKTLTQTTQMTDGGATVPTKTIQYAYQNADLPMVSKISEWNYYSGSQPSTPDRVTTITYGYNCCYNHEYPRPTSVTVANGAGTQTITQTNTTYDSYGSGLTSVTGVVNHDDSNFGTSYTQRGNPTQVQRCSSFSGSSCSASVSTSMAYDTTGQVTAITDPANNTTTLSHADCFYNDNNSDPPSSYTPSAPTNAYLTKVTLPMSGSQTTCYYYGTGEMALSTDQNSQTTYKHYYDSFSRPTETVLPDGGWNLLTYPSETEGDSYIGITTSTPSTSCTSCRHDETTLDNLGRVQYAYLVNDPDGETTSEAAYDSNGRVQTFTYPYRSSASASETYAYDALDRVLSIAHSDNTQITTAFGGNISGTGVNTSQLCSSSMYGLGYPVLVTDEAGKRTEAWTDGFGRTIEVDEPDASGNLTKATCYAYDLNNDLTEVVSVTGQTRNYWYDALSRLTKVGTPETNVGGTQYYITFSYPVTGSTCSGNPGAVCQRTDSRGVTTTYTYDAVDRLTQIAYSDGTATVKYCYDGSNSGCISGGYSSSNGAGRRTAMSDGSGNTGWSYSATGRVLTEQRTIAGITKTISYSYNLDGSLKSITYPSGHIVNYTVGNAQRPLSATDSSGSPQYAATASYAPSGAISSVIYGPATGFNGTTESRGYNNRLETTSIQASSSNGTAVNLGYCFNAFSFSNGCSSSATNNNGSVTGFTNGVDSGEGQTFAYDYLNRILTAATKATSGSDCWGQSFSGGIDAVANLTGISVTQCSAGSLSISTDGENHLSSTGFSYDNSGNMTADDNYTYAFDAENRMKQTSGMTGGPYCYIYDGTGLRVEKGNGGTCPTPTTVDTLYWRSITGGILAETDKSGNTINEYVFFAGRTIAQRTSSGGIYYYYADALGTIHTATNATGQPCYDADFTPYGQEFDNPNVSQSCKPNYRFGGYELDSETGLYYALARHYSWRLGRFMSPDPMPGDGVAPQSLNLYAYTMNSPTVLSDPSGLDPCPLVIAGTGDNQNNSTAMLNFAKAIGANVAFPLPSAFKGFAADGVPYLAGANPESASGIVPFVTSGGYAVTAEAIKASSDGSVGPSSVFTFSAGAAYYSSAPNPGAGNVAYVMPYFAGYTPTQGTKGTFVYSGTGPANGALQAIAPSIPGAAPIALPCAHDQSCAFPTIQSAPIAYIPFNPGKPCKKTHIYQAGQGGSGGGGGSNGSGLYQLYEAWWWGTVGETCVKTVTINQNGQQIYSGSGPCDY